MADFKIGDKIKLKSGGPTMTVHEVDPDQGICLCSWFDIDDRYCSQEFYVEMLILEEEERRGPRTNLDPNR